MSKVALIGGLVERGKSAAGVRGFELGDGVVALGGVGKIEAAQFAIQNAAVGDLQGYWPGRQLARKVKRGLLQARIKRNVRGQILRHPTRR